MLHEVSYNAEYPIIWFSRDAVTLAYRKFFHIGCELIPVFMLCCLTCKRMCSTCIDVVVIILQSSCRKLFRKMLMCIHVLLKLVTTLSALANIIISLTAQVET